MTTKKNQLRLQLPLPVSYDYHSWLRHSGVEEACNRLALWTVHGGRVWLDSVTVAGKSHLLRTMAADHPSIALLEICGDEYSGASWHLVQQWMKGLEARSHWMIDIQAGPLPQAVAHALFHVLERARDLQRPLIVAWRGNVDPLPPELSSRLLAMEKITLSPPRDDALLLQILGNSAGKLQWDIREQVLQSMLTYLPRDLDILVSSLRELERLSFEQKHKPGPAWVKQQLIRIAEELHPRLL
ncbi:hypothetical protein Ga0123462_0217 [Mariprofundus ferrinatatus]|uniref:Uncharacterized protein n=1 Tax=Mariprofundus ferrinatatus TaxID=1921087 RepID=A0A2K8L1A1_9PROT|nr:hypothetical protein [Mariprofundus ferrinatatus]ATX81095.1 hypothetical protein Ga0123462_0217 [Mariprofundus ferrinatatus]